MAASLLLAGLVTSAGWAQYPPPSRPIGFPSGGVVPAGPLIPTQVKDKDDPSKLTYPYASDSIIRTGGLRRSADDDVDFNIQIEFPDKDRLFGTRDSERAFRERVRTEASRRPGAQRVFFPEEIPLSRDTYAGRAFPQEKLWIEPNFVVHNRTYFEQPNFERAGWDLGPIGVPIVVAGFYYDALLLPYHHCTRPFEKYETNVGKCMPGDSTPLMLYPEEASVTGLVGMGLFYTTFGFAF